MRKNLLLLVLAFISAFALVSCIQNAPEPTGDADKDGKAVADYIIIKALKVNSVEDYKEFVDILDEIDNQFESYYAIKGTDANDYIDRYKSYYQYYMEYNPKYEEAVNNLMKYNKKLRLDKGEYDDDDE